MTAATIPAGNWSDSGAAAANQNRNTAVSGDWNRTTGTWGVTGATLGTTLDTVTRQPTSELVAEATRTVTGPLERAGTASAIDGARRWLHHSSTEQGTTAVTQEPDGGKSVEPRLPTTTDTREGEAATKKKKKNTTKAQHSFSTSRQVVELFLGSVKVALSASAWAIAAVGLVVALITVTAVAPIIWIADKQLAKKLKQECEQQKAIEQESGKELYVTVQQENEISHGRDTVNVKNDDEGLSDRTVTFIDERSHVPLIGAEVRNKSSPKTRGPNRSTTPLQSTVLGE
jgi:hypothetical protein